MTRKYIAQPLGLIMGVGELIGGFSAPELQVGRRWHPYRCWKAKCD
jgi:hypothetical protein